MKLKDEAKEAAAKVLEARGYPKTADALRSEDARRRGCLPVTLAAIRAALEVLGQYEEVEVVRCEGNSERWLRLPGEDGRLYNPLNLAPAVILRRKPEPAPDLKELARRAVKAYREGALDQRKTMAALEKELDK